MASLFISTTFVFPCKTQQVSNQLVFVVHIQSNKTYNHAVLNTILSRYNLWTTLNIYISNLFTVSEGPSLPWSYGSWIYNYLCNQSLSLVTLWVRIPLRRSVLDTTLCDKPCQWLAPMQFYRIFSTFCIKISVIFGTMHKKMEIICFIYIFKQKFKSTKQYNNPYIENVTLTARTRQLAAAPKE